MTNKNKNIEKLVDRPDLHPTSDRYDNERVEESTSTLAPEIEADEATFDINDLQPKTAGRTKSELEVAMREQSTLIGELAFEIEQQRISRRSLEAELEAREEIGANIAHDLQETRDQLTDADQVIQARHDEIRSMRSALDGNTQRTTRLRTRANRLQLSSRKLKDRIRSLESQLASAAPERSAPGAGIAGFNESDVKTLEQDSNRSDEDHDLQSKLQTARSELDDLRSYVNRRKDVWEGLENELSQVRHQLETKELAVTTLTGNLDARNTDLALIREQYSNASAQLSEHKSKIRELNGSIRELEHTLHFGAEVEIAKCRSHIAEQSGELAALRQELKTIRQDNARIERYADQLRLQVSDSSEKARVSLKEQDEINARLSSANQTIKTLSTQLEAEQQLNVDHTGTIERMRQDFEREIRQIRFELGAAEETIAGQEALNEQLVSNLIDHQGYRRALESQLDEVEKENEKTIQKLTVELKRARHENEDYDRKLSIKDSAIAELIQELSNHTSNIEIRGEAENVLQKIDGFGPATRQPPGSENRNRVVRLLIGNVDGRELRFPLFKERLTVGRTSHNDIQLNLQYVSRRHAVITTESGETRVIDWGSKNGVFVNRRKVTDQVLRSGDTVSIGMADFKYEERNKR